MKSIPLTRARAVELRRGFAAARNHPDIPQGIRDELTFAARLIAIRGDRATLAIPDAQTLIALQAFAEVFPLPEVSGR